MSTPPGPGSAAAASGWRPERLDLDAYLARIDVPRRAPSLDALAELQAAHVRTFTFDDVDVLLGSHPGVDLDAVQAKLVGRGRGGYCFEHVTLVAAALELLGYRVQRRLGRVGPPGAQPRTHAVIVVDLPDGGAAGRDAGGGDTAGPGAGSGVTRVLVDPGFGFSLAAPVPLADGAVAHPGGWEYRVRSVPLGDARGWALHRRPTGPVAPELDTGDGWELAHTHEEPPSHPVDFVAAHHYTSTFPGSLFRRALMLGRHEADGGGRHVMLSHGAVTIRRPGMPTEHTTLTVAEVGEWVRELAPQLDAEERDVLLRRVGELREADAAEGRD